MGRGLKRKPRVENPAQMAKQWSHRSPVDREDLSHMLLIYFLLLSYHHT